MDYTNMQKTMTTVINLEFCIQIMIKKIKYLNIIMEIQVILHTMNINN